MYALSWKLLITRLLSEYFATLLKRLYLKKIAAKCSIFLHQLYFLSYGKFKSVFWIRMKFHLGRAKGRGRRGLWGRSPNEGWFCKISIIKQDTNVISQTFGQTNFKLPPLQSTFPKTCVQRFSSDSEQFLLAKNNFVYF